jgi:hypothetical protein
MVTLTGADTAGPLPIRAKLALAGEILWTYARARWLLRREALEAVIERLPRQGPAPALSSHDAFRVGLRLGYVVGRTLGRLPTDSRCLVRAVVLAAMLSRRGIEHSLVIGVRSKPEFGAHAWVEHNGLPLLPDEAYARLVELPAPVGLTRPA